MELTSPLSFSQDHATGPYPDPDYMISLSFLRSVLILSSHLCLSLPNGLFPSGFPIKNVNIKNTKLILLVVFYGCETWSLKEEQRLDCSRTECRILSLRWMDG
jgi:hypothetical protein